MINYSIKDKEKLKAYLEKTNQLDKFLDIDKYKIAKAIKENQLKFKNLQDAVKENKIIIFRTKKN